MQLLQPEKIIIKETSGDDSDGDSDNDGNLDRDSDGSYKSDMGSSATSSNKQPPKTSSGQKYILQAWNATDSFIKVSLFPDNPSTFNENPIGNVKIPIKSLVDTTKGLTAGLNTGLGLRSCTGYQPEIHR